MNLSQLRRQIPVTKAAIYLNNCGASPLSLQTIRAIQSAVDEQTFSGGRNWPQWMVRLANCKKLFAELIGASFDEIACIPNVTTGLWSIITSLGLGFSGSENVVSTDLEFPNMIHSWRLQKDQGKIKEVRLVKSNHGTIEIDQYEKLIDDKTRVVAVHYSSYMNGHLQNLGAISAAAHRHGAIVIVDAYQAAGLIPIDVRREGIDILLTGTHKWLMGPTGIGFMFVDRELIQKITPAVIGWFGIEQSSNPERFNLNRVVPAKNAAKFDGGSFSVLSASGAEAAMKFLIENKFPSQFDRVRSTLQEVLISRCSDLGSTIQSPLDKNKRGGIVNIRVKDPAALVEKMARRAVFISEQYVTGLGSGVRVAPHVYNTVEEIETFVDYLRKLN